MHGFALESMQHTVQGLVGCMCEFDSCQSSARILLWHYYALEFDAQESAQVVFIASNTSQARRP